jgi:hypothetical protein
MLKTYNVQLIYYKKDSGDFYKLESYICCVPSIEKVWEEIKRMRNNQCLPGIVGRSCDYITLAILLDNLYKDSKIIL